ncbi:MAG: hypothetical protein M3Y71_18970 [Actinomycetota bacterium]|nr:hypothetical protein [Actinomycetota bacterium]
MATISINGSDLTIDVEGMDKFWSLKSRLTIPLAHVRGATADPGMAGEPKGWRGPGTHLRGVIVAGTFHQDGKRVFWDVHDTAKAVVVELSDDTYQRLVIEVDDPRATVELIESAVSPR